MSSVALGIIADDLTGGAAIAGEITRDRGIDVDVVTLPVFDDADTEAVVVETGSRYLPERSSSARVVEAHARLRDGGCSAMMKKIDSTLKGNVATELAAFVAAVGGPVVIAPSCPTVGLGLLGGVQVRGGAPDRDVSAMLEAVLGYAPTRLDLDVVRQGPARAAAVLRERGGQVVLADALTDADLATVAEAAVSAGIRSFAGTYGLGAAIAAALELGGPDATPADPGAGPTAERILVIAGSANPVSTGQIRRLVDDGAREIAVDVPRLLREPVDECARIATALAVGDPPVVVIHSAAGDTRDEVTRIRDLNGWTERELADRVAPPFANAIRERPGAGIYFLGGETTGAICDRLGWNRFTVVNEIAPAVPLLRVAGSPAPFALTKPGAFGEPDDLVAAVRARRRQPR